MSQRIDSTARRANIVSILFETTINVFLRVASYRTKAFPIVEKGGRQIRAVTELRDLVVYLNQKNVQKTFFQWGRGVNESLWQQKPATTKLVGGYVYAAWRGSKTQTGFTRHKNAFTCLMVD